MTSREEAEAVVKEEMVMSSDEVDPLAPTFPYRQVAVVLAGRIRCGELVPEQRIPAEKELAAEFGVARETVRRAIATLRDVGLVSTVARRGTYVTGSAADRNA